MLHPITTAFVPIPSHPLTGHSRPLIVAHSAGLFIVVLKHL